MSWSKPAKIDGANSLQVFPPHHPAVDDPGDLLPADHGADRAFSQLNLPLLLVNVGLTGSGGVPSREIYLYMIHAYYQIFTSRRYGYGTALLWLLFIGVLI